jgi:ABC-type uncharacterized transport system permease subunit
MREPLVPIPRLGDRGGGMRAVVATLLGLAFSASPPVILWLAVFAQWSALACVGAGLGAFALGLAAVVIDGSI